MKELLKGNICLYVTGLLAALGMAHTPLYATVTFKSITPSLASPQSVGTVVTWTVKASDTGAGPLTFQFNVKYGTGSFVLAKDFNLGSLSAGTWTAQPFVWNSIQGEGTYTIQVIAKDFTSGESATQTASYTLKTRVVNGQPTVKRSSNPLVALFSAASCPTGSSMRVAFFTGTNPTNYTSYVPCSSRHSMNFYVAGMLPSTTYTMFSQVLTNGSVTNGSNLSFTTGALPTTLPNGNFFPSFTVNVPAGQNTDTADSMLLWSFTKIFAPVATDLNGNIIWYYAGGKDTLLTRPVAGGTMLTIQDGSTWASSVTVQQLIREIDLAGNVLHETNTGIVTQQLVAMGATDATPCGQITHPQVGNACLDDFHHEVLRLPNGDTAFLAHVEKLFPPGTQGNTSGQPVDILSEMMIVLDSNWQVKWYYDAFQHAGGTPQLDISLAAPLNETCKAGGSDCPTRLALASVANDWTHANTINYVSSSTNPDSGDFLLSMRSLDRVARINYANGAGNGNILWLMGPPETGGQPSAFTFNNLNNDPWPWYSHQHDVTYVNGGDSVSPYGLPVLTIFDNGNSRVAAPPLGLGNNCVPSDCHSRGIALIVNESTMQVTPALSADLGVYTSALGGAQYLQADGNYFFQTGLPTTNAIEILPTPGTINGTQVLNVGSPDYSFRGWQLSGLYNPPL